MLTRIQSELRACPPRALAGARANVHLGVQLLSLAARANLKALADDGHSSLVWDPGQHRFLSQPLTSPSGPLRVALALPLMRLSPAGSSGTIADSSRYAMVSGRVRLLRADKSDEVRGHIMAMNVNVLNVPYALRSVFEDPAQSHPDRRRNSAPFEATVAVGKRLEPWITAATGK